MITIEDHYQLNQQLQKQSFLWAIKLDQLLLLY